MDPNFIAQIVGVALGVIAGTIITVLAQNIYMRKIMRSQICSLKKK